MYDLIVIGAGPAGYEAALKASELNKKVLVIEKNKIGGTCLNYGCIPTKSLLFYSHKIKDISQFKSYGINIDNFSFDYNKILDNKNKTVDRLVRGIEFLFKKNNIDLVYGTATIENENLIKVDNSFYEGKYILIATGSKVKSLNIEGYENTITSKEFLDLDLTDTKSAVIIGGGVIGVEIATILKNLNIKVTIIEAMDRLIPNFDIEASQRLKKQLSREGVKIYLNSKVKQILKNKVITDSIEIEGDFILSSVGRVANTDNLDPNNILNKENSYIIVNKSFQTNISNIFAVGDCVKQIQLAHYASACALNVVNSLFGTTTLFNLKNVPQCIYTDDEISMVGESENDEDIVLKSDLIANAKAIIDNQNKGFIKLIFTKEGYLKGALIMCNKSSDMINIFVNSLNKKATIEDLKNDIYPHPSYSESILSLLSQN